MTFQPPPAWSKPAWYALGALRIILGFTFLWAGLDKLLGLGYSTPSDRSWLHGGSPTKGYLSSSFGPLASMYHAMAGHPVVDTLFMVGLFGVGIALTFGVATRLGGWGGFAMVLLMYSSHPIPWGPHTSNPILDDHITEAAALMLLACTACGEVLGLGTWWRSRVKASWLQ